MGQVKIFHLIAVFQTQMHQTLVQLLSLLKVLMFSDAVVDSDSGPCNIDFAIGTVSEPERAKVLKTSAGTSWLEVDTHREMLADRINKLGVDLPSKKEKRRN